jgi:hypothetical protein
LGTLGRDAGNLALAEFGILRADLVDLPATVTYTAAPTCA